VPVGTLRVLYQAADRVWWRLCVCLEPKGKKWLNLAARFLPNYQIFMRQLHDWQDQLNENTIALLLNLPFKSFITTLDTMIKEFHKNNGKNVGKQYIITK